MRLRPLVGGGRGIGAAVLVVAIPMTLAWPVYAVLVEHDRHIRIADFRTGSRERHLLIWQFSCLRVPTLKAHRRDPPSNARRFLSLRAALSWKKRTHMDMRGY